MTIQKEDLFFSEQDFNDKQQWLEYSDHILAAAQEKHQDADHPAPIQAPAQ